MSLDSIFLQLAKRSEEMVFSKTPFPVLQFPVQTNPRPRRYVKIMQNLEHISPHSLCRHGVSYLQTWTEHIITKQTQQSLIHPPESCTFPFHNRYRRKTSSISHLLATSAQTVHAYSEINLKSLKGNNASLTLSFPSLLPSRFSSLALFYNTLSPDRTSPSTPYSLRFSVLKP